MRRAATEYHLIDLLCGVSHGGFISLEGAREYARAEDLPTWDIWHGNSLVERHNPIDPPAPRWSAPVPPTPTPLTPEPFLTLASRALRNARKRADHNARERMLGLAENCVLFARIVARMQGGGR